MRVGGALVLSIVLGACEKHPPPDGTTRLVASAPYGKPLEPPKTNDSGLPDGVDCHGFGGMIHGRTTCVHVDLATGVLSPLDVRPYRQPGVVTVRCDKSIDVGARHLTLRCKELPTKPDAGWEKPVDVSFEIASADGGKPTLVHLDRFDDFWDFVNVWVLPKGDAADLAIDYGIDE
ncbi:MAG TPA: hypothetical protein VF407_22525 [Polyangiaceae bacterium]